MNPCRSLGWSRARGAFASLLACVLSINVIAACSSGDDAALDAGASGPGYDAGAQLSGLDDGGRIDGGEEPIAGKPPRPSADAGDRGAGRGSEATSGGGGRDPSAGAAGGDPGEPQAGNGSAQAGSGGMQAQAGSSGGTPAQAGSGGGEPPATSCYDLHPGALFCDDFDMPGLGPWTHHGQGPEGRTSRTTTTVHAGRGALDSIKYDPGDSQPIYRDVLGRRSSGQLYFRTYLYVPGDVAIAPAGSRASLLALGESSGALGAISLVLWQNALSLQINGRVMSDVKATYDLPRDRWLCVQIDFAIAEAGSARLRVDGRLIAEGVRNTLMPTHYDRLWLGVNWVPPEQTDDVRALYDDVVLHTSDIACD